MHMPCLRVGSYRSIGNVKISSYALYLALCLPFVGFAANGSDYELLSPDIQNVLKYRENRAFGGVYRGKVRPFYVDDNLFLQPIDPKVSNRASCAARSLLRLDGERTSLEFRNKFAILLDSWVADREVVLIGKGTCSIQGDELIFAVIPY